MPDELVEEGAAEATDDRAGDVDPELLEWRLRADQGPEEIRADLAGRIEGGAGDRADEDDDPVDDEADDDPGEPGRSAAIDGGAEDREDEDRGADGLGRRNPTMLPESALTPTAPRPSVCGIVADQDDEGQGRADERAHDLRGDVARSRSG